MKTPSHGAVDSVDSVDSTVGSVGGTVGGTAGHGLRRTLTAPKITFLVIAAAAPLTAVVGTVPLAFALGNGPGLPGVFVLAGLTLLFLGRLRGDELPHGQMPAASTPT